MSGSKAAAWRLDVAQCLGEVEREWLLETAARSADRDKSEVTFGFEAEPEDEGEAVVEWPGVATEPEPALEPVVAPESEDAAEPEPAPEFTPAPEGASEPEPSEAERGLSGADVVTAAEATLPFSLACAEYVHRYGVSLADVHEIAQSIAALPQNRLRDVLGGVALVAHLYCKETARLNDKLDLLAVLATEEASATGGKRPTLH